MQKDLTEGRYTKRALSEKDHDYVFDGFAHRPFNESTDGWFNEQPVEDDYPSIGMAKDLLSMFEEIKFLRKENWLLRKKVESLEPLLYKS